jgi:hypothetical protein
MSIPPRLASKLNETLGPTAAGDLVTWLDEMRAEHLEHMDAVRADFAELRQELLAVEMRLSERLTSQIHAVDTKVDQRHAELMRWSFVFWVGAVAAIAALAGIFR